MTIVETAVVLVKQDKAGYQPTALTEDDLCSRLRYSVVHDTNLFLVVVSSKGIHLASEAIWHSSLIALSSINDGGLAPLHSLLCNERQNLTYLQPPVIIVYNIILQAFRYRLPKLGYSAAFFVALKDCVE